MHPRSCIKNKILYGPGDIKAISHCLAMLSCGKALLLELEIKAKCHVPKVSHDMHVSTHLMIWLFESSERFNFELIEHRSQYAGGYSCP